VSDFIKMFDGFIESSKQTSGFYNQKDKLSTRWKYCVALSKLGWKANKCEKVNEQDLEDVIVTWSKEGQKDISIRLSWTEQCLWLEYLESEKERTDGSKCE
jgi:hypothetical protein